MSWFFEFASRNWALMSISTTLAVLVIVPLWIVRKYALIALNILDDLSPPVWPEMYETGPMDGEPVSFTAFDGHVLHGHYLLANAEVARKGTVIFAHEFGMDRRSSVRYNRMLRRAGYDVFVFDFRGHGSSAGEQGYKPRQFPSDREQWDTLGAIAIVGEMLEKRGLSRDVGLFGISRGGGAVVLAASAVPEVRAIVTDGAFCSDLLIEFYLRRWACIFAKIRFAYENHPPIFWRFLRYVIIDRAERAWGCRFPSVCKALGRMGEPAMLFIHGERDTYVPVDHSQVLYQRYSGPKYMWTVPGARHNESAHRQPEEYAAKVVGFFDRHLASPGTVEADDESLTLSDLAQPLAESTSSAANTIAR